MNKEEMQHLLIAYVDLILKCENALRKYYGLDNIPYLETDKFPKKSKISTNELSFEYHFHGSGCTILLEKIELHYDIYVDRSNYLVTSPWKFMKFANGYLQTYNQLTEVQIAEWLKILSDENILKIIYEDYLVYEISFKWYGQQKSRNVVE
jgi:formate-dependent nitrite reductase cytochrome c552 subunit